MADLWNSVLSDFLSFFIVVGFIIIVIAKILDKSITDFLNGIKEWFFPKEEEE